MTIDYEDSIKLLYHHVTVKTIVKRASDFESEFIHQNYKDANEHLIFAGYLKVIDPISRSVILCLIESERIINNLLVLGQNIHLIEHSQDPDTVASAEVQAIIQADSARRLSSLPFFAKSKNRTAADTKETVEKSEVLSQWLSANRIPHEIRPDTLEIVVGGVARIRPPYEHESDYICPTRIMLKRIMHIVNSRPQVNET